MHRGLCSDLCRFNLALADARPLLSCFPSRFEIKVRYYHDLALAEGSLLNVFSGGTALDLSVHSVGGGWDGARWGPGEWSASQWV